MQRVSNRTCDYATLVRRRHDVAKPMLCSCSSELLLWYNHNCRWPVITLSLMMAFGLLSAHGSFSIEQGSSGAPHLDKPTQHVDCFPLLFVSSFRLFFSSLLSLLLALSSLLAPPRATWYQCTGQRYLHKNFHGAQSIQWRSWPWYRAPSQSLASQSAHANRCSPLKILLVGLEFSNDTLCLL